MPRAQARQRLQVGNAWQDNDLVFATSVGTPLDAANVRRSFRRITKAAGLAENWTPRELRHSFVSIMNDNGVTIEQIADLVGLLIAAKRQACGKHGNLFGVSPTYRNYCQPATGTASVSSSGTRATSEFR